MDLTAKQGIIIDGLIDNHEERKRGPRDHSAVLSKLK